MSHGCAILTVAGSIGWLPALLRAPAAINQNIRPGDKSGVLGAQIQRKLADLLHLAPPSERDLRYELRVGLRILHQRRVHFRRERAGLMPFTVIASGASSSASARVNPSSADLLDEYAARPGSDTQLMIDVMLMIRP